MKRRPTMDDVAAKAGVSRALVSLVMRDSPKVSPRARAVVTEAADELGYRPNLAARNLAAKRSQMLGVVFNDLHNPFFAEVSDGIQEVATEAGYQIVINSGYRRGDRELSAIETLIEFKVDAVIALGLQVPWPKLKELTTRTQIPLVAVARQLESIDPTHDGQPDDREPTTSEPARTKVTMDTVNTDDEAGARLAVGHLVSLGHRHIAHIDGGRGAGSTQRRTGYRRAMAAHGLSDRAEVVEGEFTEAAGRSAARHLLRTPNRPTAIFAANDLIATGVITEARQAGLIVPNDLSVVGYDNTFMASLDHIGLTTINQPRHTMGRIATQLALKRMECNQAESIHEVLQPTLVARATSTLAPNLGEAWRR